jgi:hypothetical protein
MNERIEKLAEQAVLQANEVFDQRGKDYSGIVMEKFAELIVRECANRATWAQDTGAEDIGGEVLKHFGVEE